MSWISQKWDELTGRNQKVDPSVIRGEYEDAYGGARDTYSWLEQQGKEMMDPNSPMNRMAKERMDKDSADTAAEMSRLSGRNAAQSGGAPAGAIAAQTTDTMNKATAGSLDAFNKHLQGTYAGGVGMVSGAAGNLAQMNNQQMQAMQQQRQANNMIDREATMMGAGLIGGAGQMMFGMPPTGGYFSQRGGYIGGYQDGGYIYGQRGGMLSTVMGPKGPMGIKTRLGGQLIG